MNTQLLSTADLSTQFNIIVEAAGLDHKAGVPIISGAPQRQGDVYIAFREEGKLPAATTPIPQAGVPVVKGENGGNTHHLLAGTPTGVFFDPYTPVQNTGTLDIRLGVLTVEAGAVAYLGHPEHGFNGIGEGTYLLKRQREQRDEIELVQD